MKKIILIAAGVVLLGGATFGGLMLGKSMAKAPAPVEDKTDETEVVADANGAPAADAGDGAPAEEKAEAGGHGEPAKSDGSAPADAAAAKPSRKDLVFSFGKDFVVNLLDPHGNVDLQTQIEIEAVDMKGRAELDDSIAPLRDATIMLLSSKQRDEVSTPEGKDRLKRELLARYEGIMRPGVIRDIYFTDQTVIRQ